MPYGGTVIYLEMPHGGIISYMEMPYGGIMSNPEMLHGGIVSYLEMPHEVHYHLYIKQICNSGIHVIQGTGSAYIREYLILFLM